MKVFLHTRKRGESDWQNVDMDFAQIPHLGECVKPSIGDIYYEVRYVLHTPFRDDMDAEVFAVETKEDIELVNTRDRD